MNKRIKKANSNSAPIPPCTLKSVRKKRTFFFLNENMKLNTLGYECIFCTITKVFLPLSYHSKGSRHYVFFFSPRGNWKMYPSEYFELINWRKINCIVITFKLKYSNTCSTQQMHLLVSFSKTVFL